MEFLSFNEAWTWCAEHGFELTPGLRPVRPPAATRRERIPYAQGKRSGHEADAARQCIAALGSWDECLLWVTEWGVWPSGEDWPRYYAARGGRGERRSLEDAPGHLFRAGEQDALLEFLTQVLEHAWDAHVLPAIAGRRTDAQGVASHDEYIDIHTRGQHPASEAMI
ncbi:MAG: hypothetical protein KF724_11915 [Phycisphaeraceae bacterium]|nr:hypothetical protein [Phycisphaeraceae bacterium]